MRKPGYVYILTNRAIPDYIKIGMTTRAPEQRGEHRANPSRSNSYRQGTGIQPE